MQLILIVLLYVLFIILSFFFFVVEQIDRHVIGCGDRTISMWDHYNGNLLIDFEIDLPTIGRNIGCFTIDVDVSITSIFNSYIDSFPIPQ